MDLLNMDSILNRKSCRQKFINHLKFFEENKNNYLTKRGIYVYGNPGCGKTYFVKQILKNLDYDIIYYDAGDIRNKSVIETITEHNMSDRNVISMFKKKTKKIAVVMDELDGMNSGDKGGINTLIKLIRPKKTKKQQKENSTMIPIICIGNYHIDKKIREIMKVCENIELKTPTNIQMTTIIGLLLPNLKSELSKYMVNFIKGDLRKLNSTYIIYKNNETNLQTQIIKNLVSVNDNRDDSKEIIKDILQNPYHIEDHNLVMNDTERTSVGLLYHENIIDAIEKIPMDMRIKFYLKFLNNICYGDYIDRITFQKQIWSFNELSSLIKTFYNSYLFHSEIDQTNVIIPNEIRFTKVLTKYSTEYNNLVFIETISSKLNLDKLDTLTFFENMLQKKTMEEIITHMEHENYEITKLDVNRIIKYLRYYKPIEISVE